MLPSSAISGEKDAFARYHHHYRHHTVDRSSDNRAGTHDRERRWVVGIPTPYPYMVGNRLYNERYHDWDYDRLCGGPSLTLVETLPSGW